MPALNTASLEQLFDKISSQRWLPLAVNIGAFVLLMYGLAQWTWRLFDPDKPPVQRAMPIATAQPALDLQPLLSAHLFGRPQEAPVANVDPNQIPLSSLNLILTGVMARGPAGYAFLSVNGAPESHYAIGQEITVGAILEAVYPDRVLLRRGPKLESVLLKDSDAVLPDGSIIPTSSAPAMPANSPVNNAIRQTNPGVYNVDRDALTQNVTADTLRQATVAPGQNGLTVQSVQAGSMFERLGLKAGDVVRSVNGQPVHSLDDLLKIYAQFSTNPSAGGVSVEVSRGGKTEMMQYQLH